ncbi:MAG: cytochrome c oxidase subunit 3 [Archangium sp.]|nr:cytochrome c oxidase subunit 3 [Archangium sp.]MDP3573531.1 cytochrome c oxidase subunit 3 [Archangium sp.]
MTRLPERTKRPPVISSAVLGTLFFIVAEVMFFSGAISAFTISRSGALPGTWPMPGQPRLPAEATMLNTALLLLSGIVLVVAHRLYRKQNPIAHWVTLCAWALGAGFVGLQGVEWAGLLSQGLTLTSSPLGSFFYLIVGSHAVHAVVALIALGVAWLQMARNKLAPGLFFGAQTFWYFVVLLWPIIYLRVYF